jgi:hypothetical protein
VNSAIVNILIDIIILANRLHRSTIHLPVKGKIMKGSAEPLRVHGGAETYLVVRLTDRLTPREDKIAQGARDAARNHWRGTCHGATAPNLMTLDPPYHSRL